MTARPITFNTSFVASMAFSLALCAAVAPAAAQVHRWVDERGVVQYGDRPPASGATSLRTPAPPPAASPSPSPALAPAAAPSAAQVPVLAKPAARAVDTTPRATPPKPALTERLLAQQRADHAATLSAKSPGMQQLIANCKANRGVDCDTPQGMRNLQRENTPITSEEQARIAGMRARRATCPRGALGCS